MKRINQHLIQKNGRYILGKEPRTRRGFTRKEPK